MENQKKYQKFIPECARCHKHLPETWEMEKEVVFCAKCYKNLWDLRKQKDRLDWRFVALLKSKNLFYPWVNWKFGHPKIFEIGTEDPFVAELNCPEITQEIVLFEQSIGEYKRLFVAQGKEKLECYLKLQKSSDMRINDEFIQDLRTAIENYSRLNF
jgi:hypothetical protein